MDSIWTEMLDAAKAVLNQRTVSEYVTCGEVAVPVVSLWCSLCLVDMETLKLCSIMQKDAS